MAYGLFCRKKIYLTNLVFTLQSQLDNIMEQKQKMLNFSANIADGKVTAEELASDPTNFNNYGEFLTSYDAFINTSDDEGGAASTIGSIGSVAMEENNSEAYVAAIAEMLNQSVGTEYAQQYSKKIDAMENQLDMQQKRIETKLSAAEKQLEATEQAEAKAIERSTPKYDGVA
ncbi:MAG: hypothetical protein ACI37R_08530 [Candidatus Avigastranaerophilus sp.]